MDKKHYGIGIIYIDLQRGSCIMKECMGVIKPPKKENDYDPISLKNFIR